MQKIRLQICLDRKQEMWLNSYCIENRLANYSRGIAELINSYGRLQYVIKELEKKANEAEIWRERANKDVKERLEKNENEIKTKQDKKKSA